MSTLESLYLIRDRGSKIIGASSYGSVLSVLSSGTSLFRQNFLRLLDNCWEREANLAVFLSPLSSHARSASSDPTDHVFDAVPVVFLIEPPYLFLFRSISASLCC